MSRFDMVLDDEIVVSRPPSLTAAFDSAKHPRNSPSGSDGKESPSDGGKFKSDKDGDSAETDAPEKGDRQSRPWAESLLKLDEFTHEDVMAGNVPGLVYDPDLREGVAAHARDAEITMGKNSALENGKLDTVLIAHEVGHYVANEIQNEAGKMNIDELAPFAKAADYEVVKDLGNGKLRVKKDGAEMVIYARAPGYENPFGINPDPGEILADTYSELLHMDGYSDDDEFSKPRKALLDRVAKTAEKMGLPSKRVYRVTKDGSEKLTASMGPDDFNERIRVGRRMAEMALLDKLTAAYAEALRSVAGDVARRFTVKTTRLTAGAFDPSKHPRHPATGADAVESPTDGGKFAPTTTSAVVTGKEAIDGLLDEVDKWPRLSRQEVKELGGSPRVYAIDGLVSAQAKGLEVVTVRRNGTLVGIGTFTDIVFSDTISGGYFASTGGAGLPLFSAFLDVASEREKGVAFMAGNAHAAKLYKRLGIPTDGVGAGESVYFALTPEQVKLLSEDMFSLARERRLAAGGALWAEPPWEWLTAAFNPSQPREPKGVRVGGRWTSTQYKFGMTPPEALQEDLRIGNARSIEGTWNEDPEALFFNGFRPQVVRPYGDTTRMVDGRKRLFESDVPVKEGVWWKASYYAPTKELVVWVPNDMGGPHHFQIAQAKGWKGTGDIRDWGRRFDIMGSGWGDNATVELPESPTHASSRAIEEFMRSSKVQRELRDAERQALDMEAAAAHYFRERPVAASLAVDALMASAVMVAAADPNREPRFIPPDPNELVPKAKLEAEIEKRTRAIRAQIVAVTVGDVLATAGVSFEVGGIFDRRILKQVGLRARDADKSTRDAIRTVIDRAQSEGWTVPETAAGIKEHIVGLSDSTATALARTDLIGTSNASADAAAHMVFEGANIVKRWTTADDERVRPTHQDAEGQTVPMSHPFRVGDSLLDYPGDPAGPDEEVIQCRCVALYLEGEPVTAAVWRSLTAAFNPTQPRHPAGDRDGKESPSDGGKFAAKDGGASSDGGYVGSDATGWDDARWAAVREKYDDWPFEHGDSPTSIGGQKPDEALAEMVEIAGYDGLPRRMTAAEMDDLPEGWVRVWRGVDNAEQATQFRSGEYWAGKGAFGNGTYFTDMKLEADAYASDDGVVIEAVIPTDILLSDHATMDNIAVDARKEALDEAMPADIRDSERHRVERNSWRFDAQQAGKHGSRLLSDPGRTAVSRGVDGYKQGGGFGQGGGTFYVIQNRTAVFVSERYLDRATGTWRSYETGEVLARA